MNEWISVKDRLPDRSEYVLVYEKYCELPFIGRIEYSGMWVASKEFYETSGDAVVVDIVCQHDVTHWMPLPKPPKEAAK